MNKLFLTIVPTSTVLALGCMSIDIPAAQAMSVSRSFTVEITSGPLLQNPSPTFSGSFSYDDDLLTGSDYEFADLTAFNFNFDGTDYDINDLFFPGQVAFLDGIFLGLKVSENNNIFSFIPGSDDTSNAFFAYDVAGSGNIAYGNPQAVPTPALAPGIIGLLTACSLKLKRNQQA